MDLSHAIRLAAAATAALQAMLASGDPGKTGPLLEERERALTAFELAHREASDLERAACRTSLLALRTANEELLETSEKLLERVASEFRDQLGLPHPATHPAGGIPNHACLDRKA